MAELIEIVASWRSLLLVLVVFGFAPGFVLRLLVRIYPKDDPRRTELISELYMLGRAERLLFVAEQLETVLFEGAPHRVKAVLDSVRASKRSDQHSDPGKSQEPGGDDRVPAASNSSLRRDGPSRPFAPRRPLRRRWHNAGLRLGESATVHAVRFAQRGCHRGDGTWTQEVAVAPACDTGHDRAGNSDAFTPVHDQPVNCHNCLNYRVFHEQDELYDPNSNQPMLPLLGLPDMPS